MKIPTNTQEVGKQFPEITDERKATLVEHISAVPEGSTKVIDQMVANGGPEGQFVAALFNRGTPGKNDSPKQKKMPTNLPGK